MKHLAALTLSVLSTISFFGQDLASDSTNFYVYKSFNDIALDMVAGFNLTLEIKRSGENYIEVARFVEQDGDRFNDIFDIYGINYNGERYFHLHYLRTLGKQKGFVKLKEVGKHCAFFMDETIPPNLHGEEFGANLVGGMVGKEIHKTKRWVKENNEKAFIYYFDSSRKKRARILTRSLLTDLCIGNKELLDLAKQENLSAQGVLNILKSLNEASALF